MMFVLSMLHDLAGGGSMPEWGGADEVESDSPALAAAGGIILALLFAALFWSVLWTVGRMMGLL